MPTRVDAAWAKLEAECGRRLARAAAHLANALKQTLGVPAPRKRAKGSGRVYAATPATPGAPPRKLTGRGRASIAWALLPGGTAAVVGTGVGYLGRWERDGHRWVAPTLERELAAVNAILRGDKG